MKNEKKKRRKEEKKKRILTPQCASRCCADRRGL